MGVFLLKQNLMKKIFFLAIAAISLAGVLTLPACKTAKMRKNSPENVAVQFLKHMAMLEFDEARKLGTENTGRLLDMLDMLVELSKEKGQDAVLEKKEINVEVTKVAIDGNRAVVNYKGEDGKELTMDLVKEKGKWLVDMKKEGFNLDGLNNSE